MNPVGKIYMWIKLIRQRNDLYIFFKSHVMNCVKMKNHMNKMNRDNHMCRSESSENK